jgi:hypothetical protein
MLKINHQEKHTKFKLLLFLHLIYNINRQGICCAEKNILSLTDQEMALLKITAHRGRRLASFKLKNYEELFYAITFEFYYPSIAKG